MRAPSETTEEKVRKTMCIHQCVGSHDSLANLQEFGTPGDLNGKINYVSSGFDHFMGFRLAMGPVWAFLVLNILPK